MVHGNASKAFRPFMLPGDLRGSPEDLKHKLMVNFDPLRSYIADLQARIEECFDVGIVLGNLAPFSS